MEGFYFLHKFRGWNPRRRLKAATAPFHKGAAVQTQTRRNLHYGDQSNNQLSVEPVAATDPVQRTDFNADNATVEAALTDLETRVAILDRVVPDLAYYIGELGVLDVMHRDYYLSQWSMTYDAFQFPEDITVTGQAVVETVC